MRKNTETHGKVREVVVVGGALLYTLYWPPCDAREVAVSGCCFVPARWRPRDDSVRGLFRACEVTDPEVAQCVGAVLCPRDDRPQGGSLWDQLSVPGATSDTMSTNRELYILWRYSPVAISIELTQLQVINVYICLFFFVLFFCVCRGEGGGGGYVKQYYSKK